MLSTSLSADFSHQVQPAQPFAQDPSMPLLNPPNTTSQLEEARRRLEEESQRQQLKTAKYVYPFYYKASILGFKRDSGIGMGLFSAVCVLFTIALY